jgi:hypothetical protein
MSATALKSTKWRFSSLDHQNFEFVCLVPWSRTHTGLICVQTLKPNISSLGPFKLHGYTGFPYNSFLFLVVALALKKKALIKYYLEIKVGFTARCNLFC